jgi:protein tyrosine/serine phosphatase
MLTKDTRPSMSLDLDTQQGRAQARKDLIWGDHGFLRLRFNNQHHIGSSHEDTPDHKDVMYRANQPSPERIAVLAKQGIRTILNLRGVSEKGYYLLEKEACEHHEITLVDFRMYSRDTPKKEKIYALKALFEEMQYPCLMHCKSGADRTGITGVLYKHFHLGVPIAQAVEQLKFKYLHVKAGKTGMLDFFFDDYLEYAKTGDLSFIDWVDQIYDPADVKARFMAGWVGTFISEKILRRE